MTEERLQYEIDQWHKGQGASRKPDFWPSEATLCDVPQVHSLEEKNIALKGQKVSLIVHYCTQCAFSLVEPTPTKKEGKR